MFFNRLLASVSSLPNFTLHETSCVSNKFSVATSICSLLLKCCVFTFFNALVCVSLWLWHVSACMAASSTAITVDSESGNHWFWLCWFWLFLYRSILRYAEETYYLVLQRYILEVVARKKSGRGISVFVLEWLDAVNTKKITSFLFCICMQVLSVLRMGNSEFN